MYFIQLRNLARRGIHVVFELTGPQFLVNLPLKVNNTPIVSAVGDGVGSNILPSSKAAYGAIIVAGVPELPHTIEVKRLYGSPRSTLRIAYYYAIIAPKTIFNGAAILNLVGYV